MTTIVDYMENDAYTKEGVPILSQGKESSLNEHTTQEADDNENQLLSNNLHYDDGPEDNDIANEIMELKFYESLPETPKTVVDEILRDELDADVKSPKQESRKDSPVEEDSLKANTTSAGSTPTRQVSDEIDISSASNKEQDLIQQQSDSNNPSSCREKEDHSAQTTTALSTKCNQSVTAPNDEMQMQESVLQLRVILGFVIHIFQNNIRFRYPYEINPGNPRLTSDNKAIGTLKLTTSGSTGDKLCLKLTMEDNNGQRHPNKFYLKNRAYDLSEGNQVLKRFLPPLKEGENCFPVADFGILRIKITPQDTQGPKVSRDSVLLVAEIKSKDGNTVARATCDISCTKKKKTRVKAKRIYEIKPNSGKWNYRKEIQITGECQDFLKIHFVKDGVFHKEEEIIHSKTKTVIYVSSPKFRDKNGGDVKVYGETKNGDRIFVGNFHYKKEDVNQDILIRTRGMTDRTKQLLKRKLNKEIDKEIYKDRQRSTEIDNEIEENEGGPASKRAKNG